MVGLTPLLSRGQTWYHDVPNAAIFSSPKASDLNGDGILDIVVGTGNEFMANPKGVLALNGLTGQALWTFSASDQLFGTPQFINVNDDGTPDVIITGRRAQYYCLDGKSGALLWEVDRNAFGKTHDSLRCNYYTPALLPDQNGDGIADLLNIYGGGSTAANPSRPEAYLVVHSGKDGKLLMHDTVPEKIESYASPLYVATDVTEPSIFFGTGGERFGGGFYRTNLLQLLQQQVEKAVVLATDSAKGFIAPPSLADLTGDGYVDLILPHLNEKVTVFDLKNASTVWQHTLPGFEHYTSPIIGQFTGSATPDVFCAFQEGLWPFYSRYSWLLFDGNTGNVVWDTTLNYYQLTQYTALDEDGDGFDEVVAVVNTDTGFSKVEFTHQLHLLDFQTGQLKPILKKAIGLNIFSSPLLADLDNNGSMDITYCHTTDKDDYYTVSGSRVVHQSDLFPAATSVAWGGYLGSNTNGNYTPTAINVSISPHNNYNDTQKTRLVTDRIQNRLVVLYEDVKEITLYSITGQKLGVSQEASISLPQASGIYLAQIILSSGKMKTVKFYH